LIGLLMTILTQSDLGTRAFADFCELKCNLYYRNVQ